MPAKKQATAKLNYGVEYKAIEGAKLNALSYKISCHTIPYFIKLLQCGCIAYEVEDPNPFYTAAAAAILLTLEENMIVFKTGKNQPIEMKYGIFHGILSIRFTLPGSMTSIKQAAQIIKKSINKKLVVRAYNMLVAQNKEYKAQKEAIFDTVAKVFNESGAITIFGKLPDVNANKKKITALIDKVKASLPNKLDQGKNVVKENTALPKVESLYHKMLNSEGYTPIVLAFIIAALQQAGFDYFCYSGAKRIYIAKEYCQPAHLSALKSFIQSRLKFLIAPTKSSKEKKVQQISEFIHMQSAQLDNFMTHMETLTGAASINGIKNILENFNTIFKA